MTAIAELLFDRPGKAADQIKGLLNKRTAALGLLSHGLPDATRQVANAVAGLLAMPVGNLVFYAWDKQRAVRDACAQTDGRPGAVATVVVADHTLETEQRPRVHIDMAGQRIPILDLVLALSLQIDAIVVTVAEGRVVAAAAGDASGAVEFGVARPGGDLYRLVRRELRRVALAPHGPSTLPPPQVAAKTVGH